MRSEQFLAAMDAHNDGRDEIALRLMEECAQNGEVAACYMTALWYQTGLGAAADPNRSKSWLQRIEELAEQGNSEAQWELSTAHRFGDLFPLDIGRANFWLERAAEAGYLEAQHHLAWYLESGQYGYPEDPEGARAWYDKAFAAGHPETLYLYAIRLLRDGRPTDEAIDLLGRASAQGFLPAEEVLRSYTQ